MKWYCKYCDKTINKKRKNKHCSIKSHKIKAKWTKYFDGIDISIGRLNEEYKKGLYSVEEYNEIEQEIYKEFDELDDMNLIYQTMMNKQFTS